MGIVEEVGPEVTAVRVGGRVVVPFDVSRGACFMCGQGLRAGASLLGYTKLYGQVPGGQAGYPRASPSGTPFPWPYPRAL